MLNHTPGTCCETGAAEIMDVFARLFSKAAQIEQGPVDTGDGVLLYTSEVHVIDMAGRFPQENMSLIASRLGITKGAVSQTVKKLEEKGYLERYTGDGDNKTTYLRLTEAGKAAFAWHEAYHALVNGRLMGVIASLEREDRENLLAMFTTLETIFDDCPELRQKVTQSMRSSPGILQEDP